MDKQINIQELLDWYIFAGVTETCADSFCLIDNNENSNLDLPQSVVRNKQTAVEKSVAPKQSVASKNAKDLCATATTLTELKEIMLKFEGCNLKNTAASTVFGQGNNNAQIMFIGEAPGADEDRLGAPFVGRCGKLLDKMFDAIKIKREDCFITNVLPWRPPGNRAPTDEEIAICLPFLIRQIELIKPKYIVLLGGIALKSVMETDDTISRARGKWMEYSISDDCKANVVATYHPSYLLRSTAQKSKVWIDLLRLKNKFTE
jgi:DNA polymerase